MDDFSYRLIFDKKVEIYHSLKEHPKISEIAKFGL
jgi:hypothetical protein